MSKKNKIEEINQLLPGTPVSDFIPDLYLLENAKSAREFHERLAKIIPSVPKFSVKDIEYLVRIVTRPWKGKRGPKYKDERLYKVKEKYSVNELNVKRVDAIKQIALDYGLNPEAAAKLYDRAMGPKHKIKKEK